MAVEFDIVDSVPQRHRWAIAILVSALVFHALLGFIALRSGKSGANGQDFFIIYTGTRQARAGMNPYAVGYMKDALQRFTQDAGGTGELAGGFFYPPQMMLLLLPFSQLGFSAALFAWYLFNTAMVVACGGLMWVESGTRSRNLLSASFVIACMLVNPLTQRMLSLGQTSMIVPGGVVIGHLLMSRHWRWLGPAVFSFAAVKPHLALPLLAIMPLLYGWRETIKCAGFIVLFNILGCLITTGTLATLSDFIRGASTAPLLIGFNQVQYDQIISWNRILYVLSGVAINLSIQQIVAGYVVVALSIWVRVFWMQRTRPSQSLLLAAAAMASLLCSQAKGYDFVIAVLIAPYIRRLWHAGERGGVAMLFALLVVAVVPRGLPLSVAGHLHWGDAASQLVLSYRAFVVGAIFAEILVLGEPVRSTPPPFHPEVSQMISAG